MFEHGVVVGKFAPFHQGHQHLLDRALTQCKSLTVLVYANPDFRDMPQSVRAAWIKKLYPQVDVREPKDAPPDTAGDEVARDFVRAYLAREKIACDVVFTSEGYGEGFARHLGVAHCLVDPGRCIVPISGTRIRLSPYENRRWLSPVVYRHFVRTVVFLGAESTGKSTLASKLAKASNSVFVHEYGRDHYAAKGGQLTLEDYVHIAKTHQEIEDERLMEAREVLFIDTNALTTLFYSYYYNGAALPELHEIAAKCLPRYDVTVVCDTDIPFEQDGWRDNAVLREKSQRMVLMDLNNRRVPHLVAQGSLAARVSTVRAALRSSYDET